MTEVAEGQALELVHPLYLDVPMMVSFLAALEGAGVAFEGEELSKTGATATKDKEASGRVGLPSIASLFGVDLSGRLQSRSSDEESRETKVLRKHTEASLFNLLRHRLISEDRIDTLAEDFEEIKPGTIIEVEGEYLGNALQQIVDLFLQLLPYTDLEEEPKKKNPKKSGNPQVRAEAAEAQQSPGSEEGMAPEEVVRMMKLVRDDLNGSAVEDAVVDLGDEREVVLTLSREFLTNETRDLMFASRVRVVGKVARVLSDDEEINLMRRSAIGAAGPELASSLVEEFGSPEGLHLDLGDPLIAAPAIQVQPLAVFL